MSATMNHCRAIIGTPVVDKRVAHPISPPLYQM